MFLNSQATQQETIGGILRGIHKKAETQHLALSLVPHFEEYKARSFPESSGMKADFNLKRISWQRNLKTTSWHDLFMTKQRNSAHRNCRIKIF